MSDVIQKLKMTHSAAVGALVRWQAQGIIKMVRRNLYAVIDPATDAPIADKYELASSITETSYVGWHTALEFHGVAHQPFYNAFVGNGKRFNNFHFEDVAYEYCSSPFEASEENGIISPAGNPFVRVTNLERTIVDCCDRMDRAGGPEELLHCIESINLINEDKLTKYLALYNKTFLYQKVGFIMEHSQEYNHVSGVFIEACRNKGAIHTKRLTNTSNKYVSRWKLYVPQECLTKDYDYELI
ncbi:MAG: hypothetical protein Q4D56_15015 [Bacteroides sp.]|nr:hypothetical protein [Bacteroides sp.]